MARFSCSFRVILLVLLPICVLAGVAAGDAEHFDFQFANKQIADILRAMGGVAGLTVVPDETVTGGASYFLNNATFDEALALVLADSGLFLEVRDGVYFVSRVLARGTPELMTVHAGQVPADVVLRKVSAALGITILFDPLSREPLTLHFVDGTVADLLQAIAAKNPRTTVEERGGFYYLRNLPAGSAAVGGSPGASSFGSGSTEAITLNDDGTFSVAAYATRASVLLDELFRKSGKEFLFQKRSDGVIDRLSLSGKPFDVVLQALLSLSDSHVVERDDGIYVVMDLGREEILKQYRQLQQVFVKTMPVQELVALLPAGLASSTSFRVDSQRNSIILFGSELEVEPLLRFLEQVDRPQEDFRYFQFALSFASPGQLAQILPSRFRIAPPIVQEESRTLLLYLPDYREAETAEFLRLLDVPAKSFPVSLNYIRSSQLMEALPPGIPAGAVVRSPDPRLVFFQGTEDQLAFFRKGLESIDLPTPQIRYQLLLVQYQDTFKLETNPRFGLAPTPAAGSSTDPFAFVGKVGRLLDLSFDIVYSFGYTFAMDLTAGLENSTAQVLADTTLTAISGQEVSFRNTNTFRFRENERNPDTNEITPTGPSREIVSGIIFSISGWVSGNNMVTMDISATVSKRGTANSDAGSLPPTSEKVISTHVRTQAGTPVIIGGLVQQEVSDGSSRTPGLGEIPGADLLFSSRLASQENTELVMYIVPYIDIPESDKDPLAAMSAYYAQHFRGGEM